MKEATNRVVLSTVGMKRARAGLVLTGYLVFDAELFFGEK